MGAAGSVTGFALHVGELRRRDQRLKAAVVKADDVAADAFVIKLLALAFEGRHGMCVAGLFPDGVLLGVAGHAGRSADVGRFLRRGRRRRRRRSVHAGLLRVGKVCVRRRDNLGGLRVVRNVRVEGDVAVELILDRAIAAQVVAQLAEILRLIVSVGDGGATEVLRLVHQAHLPRHNHGVYVRVFARQALRLVLRHVGEDDDDVGLLFGFRDDTLGDLEGIIDAVACVKRLALVGAGRFRFGEADEGDAELLAGGAAIDRHLADQVGRRRFMGVVCRLDVGRNELADERVGFEPLVVAVLLQEFGDVGQVIEANVGNVLMEVRVALDDPLVFCDNLSGQTVGREAVIRKQITGIREERRHFHIRAVHEGFDIADTPCQSTHRVGRSATGFEAAVNIAPVENGQRETVVLAEALFDFWRVDVKSQWRVHVDAGRLGTGAAEFSHRQSCDEQEGCQNRCLTTQSKPPKDE